MRAGMSRLEIVQEVPMATRDGSRDLQLSISLRARFCGILQQACAVVPSFSPSAPPSSQVRAVRTCRERSKASREVTLKSGDAAVTAKNPDPHVSTHCTSYTTVRCGT